MSRTRIWDKKTKIIRIKTNEKIKNKYRLCCKLLGTSMQDDLYNYIIKLIQKYEPGN